MALNLKSRKIDAIKHMLSFNSSAQMNSDQLWKILICDTYGLEIISTLFTQKEIRDLGVTISLNIHTERESIPDFPAIYFVLPTSDNVSKICKDIENGMYENYYINFISPINRGNLETLAYSAYQSDSASQISKIFDQFTNFICLEDDLFVLHDDRTKDMAYSSINCPGKTAEEIDSIVNSIADGLFSVCVTMGTIPVIRCPQGNAAELVAQRLDKKLRDNLRDSRNSLFTGFGLGSNSFQSGASQKYLATDRPLLVILDRSMDLATSLHHSWTYQALIHDILGLKLNSTTVPSSSKKPTTYGLSSENDEFWREERHKSLPEIASILQQDLEVIKSKDKEMKELKTSMGISGDSDNAVNNSMADSTNKLTDTVSSLKTFLEKKKRLEVHISIATFLADQIKERKLDLYFELEEKLQARQMLQEKSLLDMLSSPDGSSRDKLRLLLLAILYGCGSPSNSLKDITDQEMDQLSALIKQSDPNLAVTEAIKYVRSYRLHSRMNLSAGQTHNQMKSGGLITKFMSNSHAYFMEGVKSFVTKKHKLPFTRIVHNLMEQNADNETDNYKYFDPKLYRMQEGEALPRHKAPFQQAVVFVIGGGSYNEYQNLIEYCKAPQSSYQNEKSKYISYGCTELFNGEQFLSQLMDLGGN